MGSKVRLLTIIILSAITLSGCAIFKGYKKINMQPFADNARSLFGEAVKISRPLKTIFPQIMPGCN